MAFSQRGAALRHGWRSGLEERVGASLEARSATFAFETVVLEWRPEAKVRRYTPDFIITTASGKEIIVETKGRWTREDRQKMKAVVSQHPDRDIRFVFQNPNARIAKGSPTTYALWCDKHLGVAWAKGDVPDAWLLE